MQKEHNVEKQKTNTPSYVMVLFCGQWSWEVVDCFADIGGIDYLLCLNFLIIFSG